MICCYTQWAQSRDHTRKYAAMDDDDVNVVYIELFGSVNLP
uniref:Uncharacterized protein n=1 Tax=Romanomermis culicivorax TaxID=13658 RepID=A0A915HXZ9_ROMCU